jgi:lipopolysaccharide export system permease protein
MSAESELTVVQATGFSPWRLARPVLVFGLIVAAMMSVLTHVLVPKSIEQLRLREAEISGSVSARLLREGAFLHPTGGVTFYIREITPEGELRDVFLSDHRQEGRVVTYTAARAYLLRDTVGPKLVMQAGLAQTLNVPDETLSTTNFTDLTYDISGLVTAENKPRRRIEIVPTLELLTDTAAVAEAAGDTLGETLEEAHTRFQQPLLAVVAALIGYSALMIGEFSRFGVGRQIVFAIFLLVVVKLAESAVTDPVRDNAALWPLIYLPSLVGLAICGVLLRRASNPFRPGKAAAGPATGGTA